MGASLARPVAKDRLGELDSRRGANVDRIEYIFVAVTVDSERLRNVALEGDDASKRAHYDEKRDHRNCGGIGVS